MKSEEGVDIADVYIHYPVLKKIFRHFVKALPKEAVGFLLGDRYVYRGRDWVEVLDYLPIKAEASETFVEPLEGSLVRISRTLEKRKLLVVGWAHSHPGYGCFLSNIDLETHRRCFSQPYHVALVMDPLTGEYDIFSIRGDSYERVHFKEVIKR